jgi:hypothetical protein
VVAPELGAVVVDALCRAVVGDELDDELLHAAASRTIASTPAHRPRVGSLITT